MPRILLALAILLSYRGGSSAQESSPPAQTARQALMEMFFSKTPGTLVKHLPDATRAALEKSGALATIQQYSTMATQMQTQGQNIQMYETGSVMLAGEDPKTGQKFEVSVEKDALRGDQDDIQVAFQIYKNGEPQRTPFMPLMTFSMKREAQLWRLNEISITIHLPLADPDLLKALTEKMQPQAGSNVTLVSQSERPAQPSSSDAMVLSAMHTILDAEATYAARYPRTGYACTLSSLDGFGAGQPSEHQAMLISSGLASGKKYGFVFSILDCAGSPVSKFVLTATPNAANFGRKAFCADQSGVIRSSDDGSAATCVASGTLVQ